ncbi:MAG: carbohydrate ABC transporter permease [Chloroflexi bacterium]|nr:carbohydrate ABC transporter permease [Chloroflexota bacterium]
MANLPSNQATPSRWAHFSWGNVFMYGVLIAYAILSIFPLVAMMGISLMTLDESLGTAGRTGLIGRMLPAQVDTTRDISPCILVTTDTYFDAVLREQVTHTRVLIDVSDEVAAAQGHGFRTSRTAEQNLVRNEHFRIPFFSNYCAAWRGANLGQYMWNTVRIVAITIAGTLIFGVTAAYAFARMEFVGRDTLFAITLATLMIPSIVVNLPNLLLLVGIENYLTTTWICGEVERCIIGNWPALTVPFMAQAINIFLMRQHFTTLPNELWEAALMDGAGHLRFIWSVVIPLSKPVILVVVLFTFIGAWNELAWGLLATPGDETWRPIAVGLQQFLDDEAPLPHLRMAGAMITILPILILYGLTQRQFIEGLSQSALKG